MKQYQDQHRSERQFDESDWVFLRLRPYRQMTVATRTNQKLSPRYYGPFMVIKKIGSVAYQLQSPAGSQVHPVFHVSLLKKKLGKKAISCIELPHLQEEGQFLVEPVTILERRIVKRRNTPVTQVLVRWSNTPAQTLLGKTGGY